MGKILKRKETSKMTFVKGTILCATDRDKLIKFIQQPSTIIYFRAVGGNNDETEFWEVRIDGIKI